MIGVKKLRIFYKLFVVTLLLLSTACEQQDKTTISHLLDARNKAMSEKNIDAFNHLLATNYPDKQHAIQQINLLFHQFNHIHIRTLNRHIHIINKEHAECEQSYTISVQADGDNRNIVQREQLQLIKTAQGWKISGGL